MLRFEDSFTLVAELLKLCEVALHISSCFCTLQLWSKSRVQLEIGPTDFVLRRCLTMERIQLNEEDWECETGDPDC